MTTIEEGAFSGCSGLTSITIPDGVTTIGVDTFENCNSLASFSGRYASSDHRSLVMDGKLIAFAPAGLTSYTTPDGVTTIDDGAFSNCSSLTNLTLSDDVTTIDDGAFLSCSGLTTITIPAGVTAIGNDTFRECDSLTNIYCKATTPPTMDWVVLSYTHIASIYVPQASVEAYKSADGWSSYAGKIVGYDF